MKILIASTPAPGHLNPLLSIASLLVESGHEVAVQVNEDLRPAVEAAGHRFLSEIPNAQTSADYYFENYPERMQKSPGMEMTGYDLVHFFARVLAAQFASLKMALYDFQADLVLADSLYWGTLPMLVGSRDKRPAIAHLGVSVVNIASGKNIPMRPTRLRSNGMQSCNSASASCFSPRSRPSMLPSPALVIPRFHVPSSKP